MQHPPTHHNRARISLFTPTHPPSQPTDGGGGEGGGGEGGRRRRRRLRIREVASGDTKAVVPGPMVTLVMISKSLGSAISVEQFVLLAPAAGKREAFAREVEGRWVGRKASNAVPANA